MKNLFSYLTKTAEVFIRVSEKDVPLLMERVFDMHNFTDIMTEASTRKDRTIIEEDGSKRTVYTYHGRSSTQTEYDRSFTLKSLPVTAEMLIHEERIPESTLSVKICQFPVRMEESGKTRFLVKNVIIEDEIDYIVVVKNLWESRIQRGYVHPMYVLKLAEWCIENNTKDVCRLECSFG